MNRRSAIFTIIIVVIILLIFFINIEDYSESLQSFPDEEIYLARFGVRSILSNQNNNAANSNDDTPNEYLNRTLIIFGVLFILWSLCIYLAARLNLFMWQDDKNESKAKGRRSKT